MSVVSPFTKLVSYSFSCSRSLKEISGYRAIAHEQGYYGFLTDGSALSQLDPLVGSNHTKTILGINVPFAGLSMTTSQHDLILSESQNYENVIDSYIISLDKHKIERGEWDKITSTVSETISFTEREVTFYLSDSWFKKPEDCSHLISCFKNTPTNLAINIYQPTLKRLENISRHLSYSGADNKYLFLPTVSEHSMIFESLGMGFDYVFISDKTSSQICSEY